MSLLRESAQSGDNLTGSSPATGGAEPLVRLIGVHVLPGPVKPGEDDHIRFELAIPRVVLHETVQQLLHHDEHLLLMAIEHRAKRAMGTRAWDGLPAHTSVHVFSNFTENITDQLGADVIQHLAVSARTRVHQHRESLAAKGKYPAREVQVLQAIADGLSSKQIAIRLGIKISSVKTLRRRIYARLDVSNAGAAVRRGVEQQLITERRLGSDSPQPRAG